MDPLEKLYKKSPELFPKTVAVAMDGNRRWAKAKNVPEIEGHRVGAECIKPVVERAAKFGIKSVTFWAFSSENFERDKNFLKAIFYLLREYLKNEGYFKELEQKGGKLKIIGDLSRFPKDIARGLRKYANLSNPKNYMIDVVLAFGYGGRDDVVRAVKKLVDEKVKSPQITEEILSKYLDMENDIDLLIRTGDRVRTSGLYAWQAAYAELYFTPTLWPDFTPQEFDKALLDFTTRVRNFGR